jgi:nicotinamidase-related amidase
MIRTIPKLDMNAMTAALLVIDVQQGLCEGDEAPFACREVIGRMNDVASRARAAHVPVIFIQHESASDDLLYGSRRWQIAEGLTALDSDLRIRKTTPDSFLGTDLEATLKSNGITSLVVCGMQSDYCVDTTVRRALALGYPVVLVEDAHTTVPNGALTAEQIIRHHNVTLSRISSFGPRARTEPAADIRF